MKTQGSRFQRLWIGVAATILLLGLWQLAVSSQWVSPFLLPSPYDILLSWIEERDVYATAFLSTATASFLGLLTSLVLGLSLAFVLSLVPVVAQALLPFFTFLQTVPIVAITPLMVIWFGFGRTTVVASSFFVSFFPILASGVVGLQSAREEWRDLGRLGRASRLQMLLRIELPSAVPYLFAGLQIAVGLAVVGAIVGEFVTGGGIGGLIDSARTQQKLEMVFGAVFLSGFLGYLGLSLVAVLRRFLRRYLQNN